MSAINRNRIRDQSECRPGWIGIRVRDRPEYAGGSIFDGYRRATVAEFLDLIDAYGIEETPWEWTYVSAQQDALTDVFQDDFGLTHTAGNYTYTYGALVNSVGQQTLGLVGQNITNSGGVREINASYDPIVWGNNSTKSSAVGQWLVRSNSDPVPEPTTMLLLGTGLIGLAGLRRKYRNA